MPEHEGDTARGAKHEALGHPGCRKTLTRMQLGGVRCTGQSKTRRIPSRGSCRAARVRATPDCTGGSAPKTRWGGCLAQAADLRWYWWLESRQVPSTYNYQVSVRNGRLQMKTPQTRLSHGTFVEQPLPAGRSCFFGSVNSLRLFRPRALAGRVAGALSPSPLADFVSCLIRAIAGWSV